LLPSISYPFLSATNKEPVAIILFSPLVQLVPFTKPFAIMGKTKAATYSTGKQTEQKIIASSSSTTALAPLKEDVSDHLPPIFFVFTVLVCSGFLAMYSFRDVFATGRIIGGYRDHAYLVCTNNGCQKATKADWQVFSKTLFNLPQMFLFSSLLSVIYKFFGLLQQ
jgi:hypothetical protein